jgi:hypothetical protein
MWLLEKLIVPEGADLDPVHAEAVLPAETRYFLTGTGSITLGRCGV